RSRKLPLLLRELSEVKNDTLAFLYGGPDQQPGDFERNQARVESIRAEFTTFCTTHSHFTNWRQAWAAFMAADRRGIGSRPPPSDPESPIPVSKPPRWKERLYALMLVAPP